MESKPGRTLEDKHSSAPDHWYQAVGHHYNSWNQGSAQYSDGLSGQKVAQGRYDGEQLWCNMGERTTEMAPGLWIEAYLRR